MTIEQIYQKYNIMPRLRSHQYRVAAVARLICDNFDISLDTENVVKTCLIHDMGNLLKFDLSWDAAQKFLDPKGLEYWENIRQELIEKYKTKDEHVLTLKIAQELTDSPTIIKLLGAVGFSQILNRLNDPDMEAKICCYSDMRVDPFGIVSVEDRLKEGGKRYQNRKKIYLDALGLVIQLETQIFAHCRLKPDQITNEAAAEILQKVPGTKI